MLPLDTHERLTPRQQLAERLILGLRDGRRRRRPWRLRGATAHDPPSLAGWTLAGAPALLEVRADTACLTEAGFLMSDALFVELL